MDHDRRPRSSPPERERNVLAEAFAAAELWKSPSLADLVPTERQRRRALRVPRALGHGDSSDPGPMGPAAPVHVCDREGCPPSGGWLFDPCAVGALIRGAGREVATEVQDLVREIEDARDPARLRRDGADLDGRRQQGEARRAPGQGHREQPFAGRCPIRAAAPEAPRRGAGAQICAQRRASPGAVLCGTTTAHARCGVVVDGTARRERRESARRRRLQVEVLPRGAPRRRGSRRAELRTSLRGTSEQLHVAAATTPHSPAWSSSTARARRAPTDPGSRATSSQTGGMGATRPNLARRIYLRREAQAEGIHGRQLRRGQRARRSAREPAASTPEHGMTPTPTLLLSSASEQCCRSASVSVRKTRAAAPARARASGARGARPPGVQQRGEGGRLPALGGDSQTRPVFRVQIFHEDGADDGGREVRVEGEANDGFDSIAEAGGAAPVRALSWTGDARACLFRCVSAAIGLKVAKYARVGAQKPVTYQKEGGPCDHLAARLASARGWSRAGRVAPGSRAVKRNPNRVLERRQRTRGDRPSRPLTIVEPANR